MKAAMALGVTVPLTLQAQADEVIERAAVPQGYQRGCCLNLTRSHDI